MKILATLLVLVAVETSVVDQVWCFDHSLDKLGSGSVDFNCLVDFGEPDLFSQ